MDITSLTFILLALPAILLLYHCIPGRGKNIFLLLASWLLYSWGSPIRLLFLWVYVLYDYGMGMLLEKCRRQKILSALLLGMSAVLQTFGLIFLRLAASDTENFQFPAGLGIYTLQGLGYLIQIYRSRQRADISFVRVALYLSFFPVNFAGPLISFQEFWQQQDNRRCNILHLGAGLGTFVCGLGEKVVLADTMRYIFDELRQIDANNMSLLTAWLTVITFSLHLYYSLLGYSEMARGLAECFGLRLPKNFQHPLFSTSISNLAENWNVTVTAWFQLHFHHFLFGNVRKKWQKYASLLLMWVIMGAWYGTQLPYLTWGLLMGIFITAERLFLRKFLKSRHVLGIFYTFLVTQFAWTLLMCSSLEETAVFWRAMLGFGKGLSDQYSLYFLTSYAPILLVSIYIATGLFHNFTDGLSGTKAGKLIFALVPAAQGALLIFCLASVLYTHTDTPIWLKI